MDSIRTEQLIGASGVKKLKNCHVTVVGVGGVGGYTAMMLVRAGIGHIRLIDFDIVSSSNINRQLVANTKTVGQKKVSVLEQMLIEIEPSLQIETIDDRLTLQNVASLIADTDRVVDAIDSVRDKVALICYCKENQIPIISAMGAGNRMDIPVFKCTDIYKTHDDGLAKVLRKELRLKGVDSLAVVTCESKPIATGSSVVGSISYYPAMCGCTIAAVVINEFLGGIKNENRE